MSTAKLGTGKRFAAIEKKAAASGARNPAAVAAAAGRAAHGAKEMAKMAVHGKEHPGKPFHDADVNEGGRERRAEVGGPVGSSHDHGMGREHDGANLHAAMGKTVPSFDHERNERLEKSGKAPHEPHEKFKGGND